MSMTMKVQPQNEPAGDQITIQRALDAVAAYGGGTVELAAGDYLLQDSIQMRSNVRLVGNGEVVLRKSDGVSSGFTIDPDWGQTKVTVEDPSGFRPGMGVLVLDDVSIEWTQSVTSITHVDGNVLYLDRWLYGDYTMEQNAIISNTFSPIVFLEVQNASVEGICLEGSRGTNRNLNGCVGAGLFLIKSRACRVEGCAVDDFHGDGVVTAITQDITVENCTLTGMSGLGLHFGAGSARAIARGNTCTRNEQIGLFLCWRVQESRFENNLIEENGVGISLGHKDTDNVFVGNSVRRNKSHGVAFRAEKLSNAGSRNRFEANLLEDNTGCGVHIRPATTDITFEGNTFRDTARGRRPHAARRDSCRGRHGAHSRHQQHLRQPPRRRRRRARRDPLNRGDKHDGD